MLPDGCVTKISADYPLGQTECIVPRIYTSCTVACGYVLVLHVFDGWAILRYDKCTAQLDALCSFGSSASSRCLQVLISLPFLLDSSPGTLLVASNLLRGLVFIDSLLATLLYQCISCISSWLWSFSLHCRNAIIPRTKTNLQSQHCIQMERTYSIRLPVCNKDSRHIFPRQLVRWINGGMDGFQKLAPHPILTKTLSN